MANQHRTPKDFTGQVFGRLTVISLAGKNPRTWLCRCSCDKELTVYSSSLPSGNTSSCGCLRSELVAAKNKTHGMSVSKEYYVWNAMKGRCLDAADKSYRHYGGRGITICDRWIESFEAFYSDMGPKPTRLTLERKDNDGNYCPENCEWATRKKQSRNKRDNRRITFQGLTLCLAEWGERLGISPKILSDRLRWKWNAEETLTTPLHSLWNGPLQDSATGRFKKGTSSRNKDRRS